MPKVSKDPVFAKTPIFGETLLDDMVLNDLDLASVSRKLCDLSFTFGLNWLFTLRVSAMTRRRVSVPQW